MDFWWRVLSFFVLCHFCGSNGSKVRGLGILSSVNGFRAYSNAYKSLTKTNTDVLLDIRTIIGHKARYTMSMWKTSGYGKAPGYGEASGYGKVSGYGEASGYRKKSGYGKKSEYRKGVRIWKGIRSCHDIAWLNAARESYFIVSLSSCLCHVSSPVMK